MDENDQIICKICLSLMINPVTLPCDHEMCFACYDNNMKEVNLKCPFCRCRISVWARRATKTNTIINWEKREMIRKRFPHLSGDSCQFNGPAIHRVHYEAGELRKEYENLVKQDLDEKLAEEKASLQLIEQLKEAREIEFGESLETIEQCANDERIARLMQMEWKRSPYTLRRRRETIRYDESLNNDFSQ